ncbi:MAG: DUF3437 domain-containing protein, partial [Cytophagales bacterium]|nr:DUF3437 domain-containing protein [Cytophagales bacterium]
IAIDILMDRFNLRTFAENEEEPEILTCSWRVRCSTLTFLQTFVSQNMFFLTSEKIGKLLECLYVSMGHSQVEVRHTAGATLSGVLRFMDEENQVQLWDKFAEEARKELPKNKISLIGKEQLIFRHRAVLGMAAIVNVHPYSIPTWFPERLVEFATHIHDPVPVKVC